MVQKKKILTLSSDPTLRITSCEKLSQGGGHEHLFPRLVVSRSVDAEVV